MANKSPKRPTTLPLHTSHRCSTFKTDKWSLSLKEFMPEISFRRTLAAVQGHDSLRGIRKSKSLQIILTILITMLVILYKPNFSLPGRRARHICKDEQVIYLNGKVVCYRGSKMKYLTYQPPGGGWNNQRIAFENAVILAKMLNRTLIVHPMALHSKSLDIRKRLKFSLNFESYNALEGDALMPLSSVIDLHRLSKLIPVKEIRTNHNQFRMDYAHLSKKIVCHNGLTGIWVDSLPRNEDKASWEALRQFTINWTNPTNIPSYRRICLKDSINADNTTSVWGIIDELYNRNEDIIYFDEGSMYFRRMFFFDKERTIDTHKWIFWYVTFAPPIWRRLRYFKKRVHFPYNAIHIRRTDHPTSQSINQDYWLSKLKRRQFLNVSSTLYVATDEKNLAWFEPFREAGFNLLFATNFSDNFESDSVHKTIPQDVIGLTEQLICAHAANFIGSYYSTFSLYIKRLRKQSSWRGQLVQNPFFGVTWVEK